MHTSLQHAKELIDRVEQWRPEVVDLATLVSLAVRIEPELLRTVRLRVSPHLSVATEADLWFSPLVQFRGPDGIVFSSDVAEVLRKRLRASPRRMIKAWAVIEQQHEAISPAIKLEEQVAWITLSTEDDPEEINKALNPALVALVREKRTGIAHWAARALPRLPQVAQRSSAAWMLRLAAGVSTGSQEPFEQEAPEDLFDMGLHVFLAEHPEVDIRVRRKGGLLEMGAISAEGSLSIRAPNTNPLLLEIQHNGDREIVIIEPRDVVERQVGYGPVRLRTAVGTVYQLSESQPEAGEEQDVDQSDLSVTVEQQPRSGQAPEAQGHVSTTQAEVEPEIPDGFTLRHLIDVHEGVIQGVAWSPDGRLLATTGRDHTVCLVEVETGELRHRFDEHFGIVNCVAWSPDGRLLATGSNDRTIRIRDVRTHEELHVLRGHLDAVNALAWSPEGRFLASGSSDNQIFLWDPQTGRRRTEFSQHTDFVSSLAWSPDGTSLVSGSGDGVLYLWDITTGVPRWTLRGHTKAVFSVAWAPDAQTFASASGDHTIRIWEPQTGHSLAILEGHAESVRAIAFSPDGRLIASKSWDDTVRLWRTETWEPVAILPEPANAPLPGLAFYPGGGVLATLGAGDTQVRIWDLDYEVLLGETVSIDSFTSVTAKVVLLGDSAVGKTALAHRLTEVEFQPTSATHGMNIWNLPLEPWEDPEGGEVMREVSLWDLAGQPGYQLVNQSLLDDTALGVVVFDPTDVGESLDRVSYWVNALRQVAGDHCPCILVAGRVDRGAPDVSQTRIDEFISRLGLQAYIETSAKVGRGIEELRQAIFEHIPWDLLPRRSSPLLFRRVREYLRERHREPDVLTTRAALREDFQRRHYEDLEVESAAFDAVVGYVAVQGLIWPLSFGDYVLLDPEWVNVYASEIVRSARNQPDGLGFVSLDVILNGNFGDRNLERLPEEAERTLLFAVVELFLEREIAYCRQTSAGEVLVLPSTIRRELPEPLDEYKPQVTYTFSGSISDIYTTLVVKLLYSNVFEQKDLFRNAAQYLDPQGSICGIVLENKDVHGTITVFFGERTTIESKVLFLLLIQQHLEERGFADTIERERIYRCPDCGEEVENKRAVQIRLKRGLETITCPVCDNRILLIDPLEEQVSDPELQNRVREIEKVAEKKKAQAAGEFTARAKQAHGEYDVLMIYNTDDRAAVEAISKALRRRGLSPWLNTEQLQPGIRIQEALEEVLLKVKAVAIIVGSTGIRAWMSSEIQASLREFVERNTPIIPVLLPGVSTLSAMPLFLRQLSGVSFEDHVEEAEPIDRLAWGITGRSPLR